MEKLIEKLVEDFEDIFKPADEKELAVRKREILQKLGSMSIPDLRSLAEDLVLNIDNHEKIEKLHADWVAVDMLQDLFAAIDLYEKMALIPMIKDILDA